MSPHYHQSTQRDQLEYALVSGAAAHLAGHSHEAARIAEGIQQVLDKLHPKPMLHNPHTGTLRDPRDVASDPAAILCVKPGVPLKAAPITLPVIDPGPDSLEREIQAKASVAPRVTPEDIQAEIVHVEIVKHVSHAGQVLRWAVLTARNGYAVVGRPSVSVSPENDNAEIGERVALDNSTEELWPLLGFRLRDNLHNLATLAG